MEQFCGREEREREREREEERREESRKAFIISHTIPTSNKQDIHTCAVVATVVIWYILYHKLAVKSI
jgi:ribosomal protein L30E